MRILVYTVSLCCQLICVYQKNTLHNYVPKKRAMVYPDICRYQEFVREFRDNTGLMFNVTGAVSAIIKPRM